MKAKYLRITMPDGSKWDVPAQVIAKNRATYYALRDTKAHSGPEFKKSYKKELKYTLEDNSELLDWAANNMNWLDVELFATKVEDASAETDYQEGWINGEKDIIVK